MLAAALVAGGFGCVIGGGPETFIIQEGGYEVDFSAPYGASTGPAKALDRCSFGADLHPATTIRVPVSTEPARITYAYTPAPLVCAVDGNVMECQGARRGSTDLRALGVDAVVETMLYKSGWVNTREQQLGTWTIVYGCTGPDCGRVGEATGAPFGTAPSFPCDVRGGFVANYAPLGGTGSGGGTGTGTGEGTGGEGTGTGTGGEGTGTGGEGTGTGGEGTGTGGEGTGGGTGGGTGDGCEEGIDEDMDGFDCTEDCDDTRRDVNPEMVEICGNEVDENCDGRAEDCPDTGAGSAGGPPPPAALRARFAARLSARRTPGSPAAP